MTASSSNSIDPFANQDLSLIKGTLDGIGASSGTVSKALNGAFSDAIVQGKSLNQTIDSIGKSLEKTMRSYAMKQVQGNISSFVSTGLSSLISGDTSTTDILSGGGGDALGGFTGSNMFAPFTAFADGGIVNQPTFFGTSSGTGLMGERGAEAIIPLSRGPDGRLGLASTGTGSGNPAPAINISISTPDPQSFRQTQVQLSSAIARAVSMGQRGL
jgi:phage-related minor tail protein